MSDDLRHRLIDHAEAVIAKAEDMRADIDADYDNDTYEAIAVELALADMILTNLHSLHLTEMGLKWAEIKLQRIQETLYGFAQSVKEL